MALNTQRLETLIEKDDGLPDNICSSCESKLNMFSQFKSTCEKTEKILRERLTTGVDIKIEEIDTILEDEDWRNDSCNNNSSSRLSYHSNTNGEQSNVNNTNLQRQDVSKSISNKNLAVEDKKRCDFLEIKRDVVKDSPEKAIMRGKFNKTLDKIVATKKQNNVYLKKDQYEQILKDVATAKLKRHSKTPLDYRRLQRYDIKTVGNENRLFFPVPADGKGTIKYFVTIDETFDIINDIHLSTGHGGRNRILKYLCDKYKNITTEAVMLYLGLCKTCQQRTKGKRRGVVEKAIVNELNSRCQIDIIDFHSQPDNDYNYILSYQDHITKFLILRPLKTNGASEVAENLLSIFTLLGAPSILQSDNGREFVNDIITELRNLWDGIKIVHGEIKGFQKQKSTERSNHDVKKMLTMWQVANKSKEWSQGLKFIQMMKNHAYHDEIQQTPYEALFGTKMKLGLKSSNLPADAITDMQSEEELTKLIEMTAAIESADGQSALELTIPCDIPATIPVETTEDSASDRANITETNLLFRDISEHCDVDMSDFELEYENSTAPRMESLSGKRQLLEKRGQIQPEKICKLSKSCLSYNGV
ncbi:KRAB-A domain-containing protein 2-like isoform X2 [Arctopsyche grandis]|uniref:KRAB-A domain-containing protein 2-like isoform X2 n=1 Tax=Arctopsyche grandis TaxID=121162 RepID=UPI00406D88BB